MKPISLTNEHEQQIKTWISDGKTQAQIAMLLGISQSTVSRKLLKWGHNNSDGNRFKRLYISVKDLKNLYWDKEMHPSQISKIYECSKQTIIKKMHQFGIPLRTKSQSRLGKLNPMYNSHHTESSKQKMSNSFCSGKRSYIGFAGNWGKPSMYTATNGFKIRMRSGWEVKTAYYLDRGSIRWFYESIWIDLGESKYLPDFYLPDYGIFIEVKGRTKGPDLSKVSAANDMGYKVLLWTAEELLKRGIITNSGNTELNRKYRDTEVFIDDWGLY